ncbi:hypothetical protein MP478_08835 [Chryseobacterium sp. WG14]|uniref:hypothetical protein n=1 Tax=Chryseobacterium sp. WG14 TaxID=2926909 RepID=UPI00211DE4F0|nr:hypothetical protein [Chryseobacterium sp. WG14]MCQ9639495.1 hypothetical protein [Chryseobacterium sp. WG14]
MSKKLNQGDLFYLQLEGLDKFIFGQMVSGEHYSDSFKEMDLRNFPELREKVYRDLNLDPNISYYELSKEMGLI